MSLIPARVAGDVIERASSPWGVMFCEACGGPIGTLTWAFHHRLLRSAGGGHTKANLMVVHGDLRWNCHNLTEYSIHQNPARSYRLGHMVRRGQDPEVVPFETVLNLRELIA